MFKLNNIIIRISVLVQIIVVYLNVIFSKIQTVNKNVYLSSLLYVLQVWIFEKGFKLELLKFKTIFYLSSIILFIYMFKLFFILMLFFFFVHYVFFIFFDILLRFFLSTRQVFIDFIFVLVGAFVVYPFIIFKSIISYLIRIIFYLVSRPKYILILFIFYILGTNVNIIWILFYR